MTSKLSLVAILLLALPACLGRPAQEAKVTSEVAESDAGPASDVKPGVDGDKQAVDSRADAENKRAEKLRKEQEREAIHRQRLGVCIH